MAIALLSLALLASPLALQTPTTRIDDLNLLPATPAQGIDAFANGEVRVLGSALGKLWFEGSQPTAGSAVWTLAAPGGTPVNFHLPGPQPIGMSASVSAERPVELTSSLALINLQRSVAGASGVHLTDGTPAGTQPLDSNEFLDVAQVGATWWLVLDKADIDLSGQHRIVRTNGSPGPATFVESVPGGDLLGTRIDGELRYLFRTGSRLVLAVDTGPLAGVYGFDTQTSNFSLIAAFEPGGLQLCESGTGVLISGNLSGSAVGHELYVTDGTASGLSLLRDINPGIEGSAPELSATFNAIECFFTADAPTTGREPYRTDGTQAGTILIRDLEPGNASSIDPNVGDLSLAVGLGPEVVFVAERSSLQPGGSGLYRTDGSSFGTLALLPPTQSTQGIDPIRELVRTGGRVVFQLRSFFEGLEPWVTDGSPGGTFALGDVNPGPFSSDAGRSAEFAGQLWFGATRADIGRELFSAAGPPDSAGLYLDLAPLPVTRSSTPREFQAAIGRVYFTADTGSTLFTSTGVSGGTTEIPLPAPWLFERFIGSFGTGAVFYASSFATGTEPWFTDGTPQGTRSLGDLAPGPDSSDASLAYLPPGNLPNSWTLGTRFFWSGLNGSLGGSLFVTDGTLAGTSTAVDLGVYIPNGFIGAYDFNELGNRLSLLAVDATGVAEWLVTDGTSGGTVNLTPGSAFSKLVLQLEVVGDSFAALQRSFLSQFSVSELEILISDGSLASTSSLFTWPVETSLDSAQAGLVAVGERLLLNTGARLLSIDSGTGAFEQLINGTTGSARIRGLASAGGGRATFEVVALTGAVSPSIPLGTWMTDGTAAGTQRFSAGIGLNLQPLGDGGRVAFGYSTPAAGPEVWVSDGTSAGTALAIDAISGSAGVLSSAGAAPLGPLGDRLGDTLLFAGSDPLAGIELHALSITDAGSFVSQPFGQGCGLQGSADLAVNGELRLGQVVEIQIDDAPPLSTTKLYVAAQPNLVPLGTCTLYLTQPLFLADLPVDAAGSVTLPFSLTSNPIWLGLSLYLQGATLTSGGGFGGIADLTNGVELVFGA